MSALFFLWFFLPVPVSASAFADSSAALVVSVDFFLRLFFGVVLPDSAFAFADSSAAPALPELFFFELFFLVVPLSASVLALWSAAAVPSVFFLRLFFDPVSFALVDASEVLASEAEFFFWDFFFVVVSEVEALSLETGSFLFFLDFFFVVAVSVLWSDVLVCCFASAGTDSAIRKHKAAIHVVIRKGSLFIWVLIVWGESNGPSLKKLRRVR